MDLFVQIKHDLDCFFFFSFPPFFSFTCLCLNQKAVKVYIFCFPTNLFSFLDVIIHERMELDTVFLIFL